MREYGRFLLLLILLLAACSADPTTAIETAVSGTMAAQVIETGVAATQQAAFTPTPPPNILCADEAAEFLAEFDLIMDRFYDAADVADNTARVSLAGPVSELQAIRRDLDNLDVPIPVCARRVQIPALTYMDHIIESMLMFMRQEPERDVTAEIKKAVEMRKTFLSALDDIQSEIVDATRVARLTPTPDS